MKTDPARVFRDADRVPAPDLWPDIEGREPDASPQPQPGVTRRIAVAMLALLIGAGGFAFAVRAFTGPSFPAAEPPSPAISYSPTEVATIDVGPKAQTNAILSAAGSVWVTAYGVKGGGGVDRDMLFRIDPVTQEITARIPLDTAPTSEFGDTGVTYADGSIWVTGGGQLQDGHTQAVLDRIDPSTNRVTAAIGLGGRFGSDVAVNDAGVWVGIFTQDNGNVQVVRVDPATNEVTDRIDLQSSYLRRLVAVSGYVMVEELEWSHGSGPCGLLTTIDAATDEVVAHDPVASCGMAGLDVWGGRIWADLNGRFVQLDPLTTKPVGEGLAFGTNHSPRGFLVQDDSGIWYAAYPGSNGNEADVLSRMDPVSGQIDSYIDLKHGPVSATLLDESLWTVNYDGTVTAFDLTGG
jgi:hypothetical protein